MKIIIFSAIAMENMSEKNEPKVIIQPLAYLKMIKHVLRFGSLGLKKSQFKEAMGMLMGKLGEKKGAIHDVIVVDAVPMTHGGHIEVAFKNEDYVTFTEIDSSYQSQGIFNVGWYHSHPGLTSFLSSTDVLNQIGFQTTNPSAIAIVWDHQLLEEENHAGFEVFRLTELSKLANSEYKEVKYEVIPPDDYSYYKSAIVDVITNMKAGKPPMLEANEIPPVVGNFVAKIPEEDDFKAPTIPELQGGPLKLSKGGELDKSLGDKFSEMMNYLAKVVAQNLKNQNVVISKNIDILSNSLNDNIRALQLWFVNELNESLSNILVDIDDKIEKVANGIKTNTATIESIQSIKPKQEVMISDSESIDSIVNGLKKTMQDIEAIINQKNGGK
jgi:proteasome lid subunit RPN8/RPN11